VARTARFSSRLDVVLVGACILLALIATVLPAKLREPVASVLRRSAMAPLVQLQKGAERWRGAYMASEREELRLDTLALAAARVPALETENDRLRRLLGLGSTIQWGFIPAVALQGRGRAEDFTVTLSAGSKAGVRERSLVVAPEGIVGLVQTVDPSMSLAILFAHPDFRVSAMSADGSAFGIVQPHIPGSSGRPEPNFLKSERYLLEMRGVPFRATLKPGAVVYSSGLGGIYPKGIPVGVVLGEMRETSEPWARTYLLRPSVNPADLTAVMILTPQRGAAGLTNVWADIGAVDSATRSIVTAGDSLARQAAVAEAAARRAAIDTAARLLRDSLNRQSSATDSTGAGGAPAPAVDPAILRARRDSAAARARRDSARRARAADSIRQQIPGAPPATPVPNERQDDAAEARR
jgi:rod shape-determining protein MreC